MGPRIAPARPTLTRCDQVVVSVAIQAHPARAELAEALAAAVDGEIVWDPEPDGFRSPWRTYRAALERTPPGVTHRVILQDDVVPCRDFAAAAAEALAWRPCDPVAFFHGGRPAVNLPRIDRARRAGSAWAELNVAQWVPAVALAWPVHLIADALAWVSAQNYPARFRADDEIIGRAMRALDAAVYATVPSLVQHPDVVPSLLGKRAWGGKDTGRVAHHFVGEADASLIDWR